jgi:HK97 family phage major capsid protein
MASYKGKEINTIPTDAMASAAKRGLEWRKEYGRGGTAVGVARARDISNKKELSISTINRMASYFARHGSNKSEHYGKKESDGGPTAWRIAWELWGGNPGQAFVRRVKKSMDAADNRAEEMEEQHLDVSSEILDEDYEAMEEAIRAEPKVEYRSVDITRKYVDEEKRTVMIALSSEEPVERSFGMEILDHGEESIDLSFIGSGRAPLLLDHDMRQQVGVIESVELDGESRRLRAKVRFGRGALASEVFTDILDGIRSNVSVGYSIEKMEKRGNDTYVAKRWRPVEGSIVSIPADSVGSGVGRKYDSAQVENEIAESVTAESMNEETVANETRNVEVQVMENVEHIDVEKVAAEARSVAQKNAAQIVELGSKHNKGDLAQEAIREGRSIEEFRGMLLEEIGSNKALESQDIGMNDKEVKRFSILRAVNALANPTDRRAQQDAAFELECSAAACQQYGRTSMGVMLPTDVLRNWTRDLNTTDDSNVLTEDFRAGDFIDVLRNQSSVMQAGARILNGLSSDVTIPKKATASTAAWLASEGANVAQTEPTFSQVTLAPKDLGAYAQITRRMIQQQTMDMEALVRDDIAQAIALSMDLAALRGDGTGGSPTGIKNTAGINTVDFGTPAPITIPSFASVVAMETAVAEDNALSGNLAYILSANMYGGLKTTAKDSGSGQFVVEPGGTMNGYRGIVSNQVETGDLYFGNFSDLLVGMWGGLDILLDPYTNGLSGTIRIRAIQTMDVAVRHAVSFCLGNDGGS